MIQPRTYSFLDNNCSLIGPGASIILSQQGNAEEGFEFEMTEEKNTMTIGSDGSGMHSLHAGSSGKVMVHLLKTSPLNGVLSNLYSVQKASSALWGQNLIKLKNTVTGDEISCQACAFSKFPKQVFAKVGNVNTWEFDAILIDLSLAGLLLANA